MGAEVMSSLQDGFRAKCVLQLLFLRGAGDCLVLYLLNRAAPTCHPLPQAPNLLGWVQRVMLCRVPREDAVCAVCSPGRSLPVWPQGVACLAPAHRKLLVAPLSSLPIACLLTAGSLACLTGSRAGQGLLSTGSVVSSPLVSIGLPPGGREGSPGTKSSPSACRRGADSAALSSWPFFCTCPLAMNLGGTCLSLPRPRLAFLISCCL
ncbi:uncharacterized protein LOC121501657 [Vulpes lagopus]|uniref:uncharacterized protein LOC121501657 n=1 Tax=Vulpes lagopus TaxID=494514 RepID=UPI001BCA3D37|nr:uncharacterized protein LOC121501657 [Vulpes lagopus]